MRRSSPGPRDDGVGREATDERDRLPSTGGRARERPAVRLLALGLMLGAALVAVLVALARPSAGLVSPASSRSSRSSSTRTLSTSAALFGDPLEAEVDVHSNDGSIAARSVRRLDGLQAVPGCGNQGEPLAPGRCLAPAHPDLTRMPDAQLPAADRRSHARSVPAAAVTYRTRGGKRACSCPGSRCGSPHDSRAHDSAGGDRRQRADARAGFERSPEVLSTLFLVFAAASASRGRRSSSRHSGRGHSCRAPPATAVSARALAPAGRSGRAE